MAVKKKQKKAAPKAKAKSAVKLKGKAKAAVKAKPASKAKPTIKPTIKPKTHVPAVQMKTAPSDFNGKITPLEDRIVVAPEEVAQTTASGLILSTSASVKPTRGVVLALGRGRRSKKGQIRPLDVKLGDRVLYAEYAGTTLKVDGVEVLILREEDILGIVDAL